MILFTADWHIKLGQKNVPASWALNRYRMFFQQVSALEPKCDLHIIGGDLFDRLPKMEELELYFDFVRSVTIPTIIYDGNHEATKKSKTFFTQLKAVTSHLNPLVRVVDSSYIDLEYGFGILPYTDLHKKDIFDYFRGVDILFTHVRGEIPPHVKPEIDLELLKDYRYVFAGDLHSHSNTQGNLIYPGSPMTTSFHRNEVSTGYLLIDDKNDYNWSWHEFQLPQLMRKTVSSPDEMVGTDYHHTIYEVEGDIQELSGVKNSELLDKKVVKRSSEATLVINPDMSIGEELREYLLYILELPADSVDSTLRTFHDYASKVEME